MSKSIEISKIIIKIGAKEISLSLDEAKELQGILNDAFEKNIIIPSSPVVIERPIYPYPWRYWTVYNTVSSNGDIIYSLSSASSQ